MLRHRYLFEQMVRRELRQKYKGSALGVLWYVVNPLVLMGAYALMFGVLLKAVSIDDYAIFLMAGLLVWLFFSQSLLLAAPSLVNQSALVRKVRFPRETIPAAVVLVQLVTFAILLAILVPVAVAVRGTLGVDLLLLIPVAACLFAFTLGLSLLGAGVHAPSRDVEPILAAALLPWFFLTPIFFEVDSLPELKDHRWAETVLEWVNPVAPFIGAARCVLYEGAAPSLGVLAYVVVAAVAA